MSNLTCGCFNIFIVKKAFSMKNVLHSYAVLRAVALHIIDFIAQFEDELARVWRKPKFARAVNYVITTDKIKSAVLKKNGETQRGEKQAEEWLKLGLADEKFNAADFFTDKGKLLKDADGFYR